MELDITFGKTREGQPYRWKEVHQTNDSVIYMMIDRIAEYMDFNETQEYLKNGFTGFTDEEKERIIPNEAGELLWLPSVKQLGFVPVEGKTGWEHGLNEIIRDCVSEEVWGEEAFQYFADPETAVERRKEFGELYLRHWTSTPCVVNGLNSDYVWCVSISGSSIYLHMYYDIGDAHPCITLKKGR